MPERIWRGGMVGAGAWSEIQLSAWAEVPQADIIALCDRHPERRDPVARQFNIAQQFDSIEAMLDGADLDFVDICTRPYSHAPLAKQSAERGLPILCQKPFCTSMEEAKELVDFCRERSVRLMVNENFRWQAWFRKARDLLQPHVLGEPFFARLVRRYRLSLPEFDHSQTYFAEMPRLILFEVGVHYLDTFRFLFGDPDTVFARLHRISPHVQGEDVQALSLHYEGLTCTIDHSWASLPVPGLDRLDDGSDVGAPRLEIDGDEGTLTLGGDGKMQLVTPNGTRQWQFSSDTVPASRVAAQQHFIECLASGKPFETSGAETLRTMALVYGCYLSAEQEVVIDPSQLL